MPDNKLLEDRVAVMKTGLSPEGNSMKIQENKPRKIDAGDVLHVLLGGIIAGTLAYFYSDGDVAVALGVVSFVTSSSIFDVLRARRNSLEAFKVGFEAGVGVQTIAGLRPEAPMVGMISSGHGSITFERKADADSSPATDLPN